MKSIILLSSTLLSFSLLGFAQEADKAFVITSNGANDFLWMNIKQINLSTSKVEKNIFERSKTAYLLTDTKTKKSVDAKSITNGDIYGNANYPTATYVAAAAFDKKSNKLFFMPMRLNELRWINVKDADAEPKFYTLKTDLIKVNTNCKDESSNITRMVIAADGNGYALSNDGNTFIQFTTGKNPKITKLAALTDDAKNGTTSIHNRVTSWGGDMVADAFGRLLVISASKYIFEVNIKSGVASFKGIISGLPNNYSTNGAAVTDAGELIVVSAKSLDGFFKINTKTLVATKVEGSATPYSSSDLASSNLLYQKDAEAGIAVSNDKLSLDIGFKSKIYPNPVTDNSFQVQMDRNSAEGKYNVVVTDVQGKVVASPQINYVKWQKTAKVNLATKPTAGTYLVKIYNSKNQLVLTDKLIVQ